MTSTKDLAEFAAAADYRIRRSLDVPFFPHLASELMAAHPYFRFVGIWERTRGQKYLLKHDSLGNSAGLTSAAVQNARFQMFGTDPVRTDGRTEISVSFKDTRKRSETKFEKWHQVVATNSNSDIGHYGLLFKADGPKGYSSLIFEIYSTENISKKNWIPELVQTCCELREVRIKARESSFSISGAGEWQSSNFLSNSESLQANLDAELRSRVRNSVNANDVHLFVVDPQDDMLYLSLIHISEPTRPY